MTAFAGQSIQNQVVVRPVLIMSANMFGYILVYQAPTLLVNAKWTTKRLILVDQRMTLNFKLFCDQDLCSLPELEEGPRLLGGMIVV